MVVKKNDLMTKIKETEKGCLENLEEELDRFLKTSYRGMETSFQLTRDYYGIRRDKLEEFVLDYKTRGGWAKADFRYGQGRDDGLYIDFA